MLRRLPLLLLMLLALQVQAAADFTLPDLDGKTHRLSDYRGKWVVVNYWATWCPPCLEEIPELIHFHQKHKDKDAVVLGVNREDIDRLILKDFVDEFMINYPVLLDEPGAPSALGNIPGLPTTYLVDPQGEVAARKLGGITAEEIEHFISNNTRN